MIRGFMGLMLVLGAAVGHLTEPQRMPMRTVIVLGALGVLLIISGYRRMDRGDR